MRYNDQWKTSHNDKLTDFYLIITGQKSSTKKIFLNNYEMLTKHSDQFKEKFFEFQYKDTGKIQTLNVSIDDNDKLENCLFVDFIEITIKNKSEAYK